MLTAQALKRKLQPMKAWIFLFTLFFPVLIFGQINFDNPPWKLGCDTLIYQGAMNSCSYKSFKIADSILNDNYNKLITYLDSVCLSEKRNLHPKPDKSDLDYLNNIIAQRSAVIKSQKDFYEYRKTMTEIMSLEYTGGSMQRMVNNTYALEITVNQLKLLLKMTAEIRQ